MSADLSIPMAQAQSYVGRSIGKTYDEERVESDVTTQLMGYAPRVLVVGPPATGKTHMCDMVRDTKPASLRLEEYPSLPGGKQHKVAVATLRRYVRAAGGFAVAWYVPGVRWEPADDDFIAVLTQDCGLPVVVVIARADMRLANINVDNEYTTDVDAQAVEKNSARAMRNAEGNMRSEVEARHPRAYVMTVGDPRLACSLWVPPTCAGLCGGHDNSYFRVNRRLKKWTCLHPAPASGNGVCNRSHSGPYPPFGVVELVTATKELAHTTHYGLDTTLERKGNGLFRMLSLLLGKSFVQRSVRLTLLVFGISSVILLVQPDVLRRIVKTDTQQAHALLTRFRIAPPL